MSGKRGPHSSTLGPTSGFWPCQVAAIGLCGDAAGRGRQQERVDARGGEHAHRETDLPGRVSVVEVERLVQLDDLGPAERADRERAVRRRVVRKIGVRNRVLDRPRLKNVVELHVAHDGNGGGGV